MKNEELRMKKIQNSEFRIQREVSLRGTKRRGNPGKIQHFEGECCCWKQAGYGTEVLG